MCIVVVVRDLELINTSKRDCIQKIIISQKMIAISSLRFEQKSIIANHFTLISLINFTYMT